MNNSSRQNVPRAPTSMTLGELITWCTANGIVAVGAIIGNSLVVLAFGRYKRLRTRTNYYIVGLSIADLIVGLISIPMWLGIIITIWLKTTEWMRTEAYRSYLALDVFSGVSSILHLMLVSLERLYAIGWPVNHRVSLRKNYLITLTVTWLVALATFTLFIPNKDVTIIPRFFVLLILFFVPLLVILATYVAIWLIVKNREHGTNYWTPNKDVKLASVLFAVSILFIGAWLPFIIMNIVAYLCLSCSINEKLVYFAKLLHYSNSMVNPILYSYRMPEFKKAFVHIIRRHSAKEIRLKSFKNSLESRNVSRTPKRDSSLQGIQEGRLLSSKLAEETSM